MVPGPQKASGETEMKTDEARVEGGRNSIRGWYERVGADDREFAQDGEASARHVRQRNQSQFAVVVRFSVS